jgi:hypothetical protein
MRRWMGAIGSVWLAWSSLFVRPFRRHGQRVAHKMPNAKQTSKLRPQPRPPGCRVRPARYRRAPQARCRFRRSAQPRWGSSGPTRPTRTRGLLNQFPAMTMCTSSTGRGRRSLAFRSPGLKVDDSPMVFTKIRPGKRVEISINRIWHHDNALHIRWNQQEDLSDEPRPATEAIPSKT